MLLRPFAFCCVLLSVMCATTMAFAQDWTQTFEAEAVNSYVSDAELRFMVVAAGEANEVTQEAAAGLAEALRAGSAALVMSDDALGSVAGLADDEIMDKSKDIPIDQVAIVRVFPGGEGAPETVVVTVRDTDGEAVWALSGTRGSAVSAREQQSAGGLGVTREASDAVTEVTESQTQSAEEAREAYDRQFIWFHEMFGVNQYGAVVATWSQVYQGKYRAELEPEEFYIEVGRPDLADEYSSNTKRATWSGVLTTLGVLSSVGGGSWWLTNAIRGGSDEGHSTSLPKALTIGGVVAMIVGPILGPGQLHPVEPSEARELADEYNKKLQEELGISSGYSPLPEESRRRMDFNFGIGVTPEGASGVINVDF